MLCAGMCLSAHHLHCSSSLPLCWKPPCCHHAISPCCWELSLFSLPTSGQGNVQAKDASASRSVDHPCYLDGYVPDMWKIMMVMRQAA